MVWLVLPRCEEGLVEQPIEYVRCQLNANMHAIDGSRLVALVIGAQD